MQSEVRSNRYEMKMACEGLYLAQAQGWVRLHSAGFMEAYAPRQVNNLYFDTPGLDCYNDHVEGVAERRKLRYRWYGENLSLAQGQLELKCKRERVGWKLVQPVPEVLDLQSCDWYDLQQTLIYHAQADPSAPFAALLQAARPWVINRYRREYYISADGCIRLTLDYELNAYDQQMTPRPNLDFRLPMLDSLVIEFKCAVEHARQLADVLAEFPLRASQHSKYVAALDSILER